jgi:hypothetical protein
MVRLSWNCPRPFDNCRTRCCAAPAVIVRWPISLLLSFITTRRLSSGLWNWPWMRAWRPRHVLNLLHRLIDGKTIDGPDIDTPQALILLREPKANVERYDGLRARVAGGRNAS